jgi:hypothetical protein
MCTGAASPMKRQVRRSLTLARLTPGVRINTLGNASTPDHPEPEGATL